MTKKQFKGCGFESHQSRFYGFIYLLLAFIKKQNTHFIFKSSLNLCLSLNSLLTCLLPNDLGRGEQA